MRVAVIGASLAGLFAAAAAAANGADTVILERDRLPKTPEPRRGVPQGRQAHVLLYRGLLSAEELLPGLREDLIAHGAARFDSGAMPWLGEYGWLPTWWQGFELVSVTRPLLEQLARQRLVSQSAVTLHEGARVVGLHRSGRQWQVITEDGRTFDADRVIDASGRSSRLPHWLTELGVRVPEPVQVDAHLGYACRLYRANGRPPLETGVLIAGTPATGRGAIALPVENGHWLVIEGGYGHHRPTREPAEFEAYLASLRDPAVADVAARLEPVSDIALYRQTSNRRHRFGRVRGWPDGLLVVGDAACAFNPVYGQGITVAAQQALLIRDGWRARRLQRGLDGVADFCWTVASGEDLRHPTSDGRQNLGQRVLARWSMELGHQAVAGDQRAYRTFLLAYHLMARPIVLFHPALFLNAARAALRGRGAPAPRPEVLEALRQAQPA
ncbi:MAG TPA: FAD-dependent oxidoreductase [Propionibacteriaceae bacterium]|nr:FAD-dependent oxidoreductase [Propionibacteriaceae bacterium]